MDKTQLLSLGFVIMWVPIIVQTLRFQKIGKKTHVTLMEYQKGILYTLGFPKEIVGPGKHPVWQGRDFLLYIDMRSRAFNYEKRPAALSDNSVAFYDIFASVAVNDVKKAIYSARDHNQAAAAAILCCARSTFNRVTREQLASNPESVTQELTTTMKARLDQIGLSLESLRVSNIKLQQAPTRVAGFSGNETVVEKTVS